jgi:hypothetical protein
MARRERISLSDMLRAQAAQMGSQDAGQTVGGQYIPNWSQTLSPLVGLAANFQGQREQDENDRKLKDWIGAAPQAEPTFNQGMGPLRDQSNVIPAATKQSRMAHLLKGTEIPEIRDEALKGYIDESGLGGQKGMMSLGNGVLYDPNTDSVRTFPEAQAALEAKQKVLGEGKEKYLTKSQELKLALEQEKQKNRLELKAMGGGTAELDKKIKEATLNEKLGKLEGKAKGKNLPTPYQKQLEGMATDFQNNSMLMGSFEDTFSGTTRATMPGLVQGIPGVSQFSRSTLAPEDVRKSENWWADYERFKNIPERYAKFGASLTKQEKDAWSAATVNRSMDPVDVRKNLQVQQDILKSAAERRRQSLKGGGYNEDEFNPYFEGITSPQTMAPPSTEDGDAFTAQAMELLPALVQTESAGDPNAVSPKGARGLGQIMPATAKNPGMGVTPLQNDTPEENLRFSRDYLAALLRKYSGDQEKALAAYNFGMGNIDAGKALPAETRAYVPSVLSKVGKVMNPNSVAEAAPKPARRFTVIGVE